MACSYQRLDPCFFSICKLGMWHEHLRRNWQRTRGLIPLLIIFLATLVHKSQCLSIEGIWTSTFRFGTCLSLPVMASCFATLSHSVAASCSKPHAWAQGLAFGKSVLTREQLGEIVTGSCFVARRMQESQADPTWQCFFCRGISLYFHPLVDSDGFCTTAIAVGLFFGCSGDHRTSERLARGLKALKCGTTCLLEMEIPDHRSSMFPPDSSWGFGQGDSKIEDPIFCISTKSNGSKSNQSDWHIAKNDQDLASLDIPGSQNDSCAIHKNEPSPIDQPFGGQKIMAGASLEHLFKRHYEGWSEMPWIGLAQWLDGRNFMENPVNKMDDLRRYNIEIYSLSMFI